MNMSPKIPDSYKTLTWHFALPAERARTLFDNVDGDGPAIALKALLHQYKFQTPEPAIKLANKLGFGQAVALRQLLKNFHFRSCDWAVTLAQTIKGEGAGLAVEYILQNYKPDATDLIRYANLVPDRKTAEQLRNVFRTSKPPLLDAIAKAKSRTTSPTSA